VIQRLMRDGWEVRALVRDAARAGALSRVGVTLATGDTLEPTGLARAARGCDVVFHAAAVITPRGGREAFDRPNIEGTRNVVAAAALAGARLVHVSSVAVYGAAERYELGAGAVDEDTPFAPLAADAHYARSKRESEAVVMEAHAAGRLWATAVRPDVIYGTHDRQFVPRLARLLRHGVAPLVRGGRSTMAVVHAANVADGMVRAAETDAAGGRAYNLANDFDVTVDRFVSLAAEGMGVRLRRIPVPWLAARAAVGIVTLAAPFFSAAELKSSLAASLDFISRDNPFTSARARGELGWDPPVHPDAGVPEAFRWWLQHR
jgi:nucleoside-diphosphate-sugar epimerase